MNGEWLDCGALGIRYALVLETGVDVLRFQRMMISQSESLFRRMCACGNALAKGQHKCEDCRVVKTNVRLCLDCPVVIGKRKWYCDRHRVEHRRASMQQFREREQRK